MMKYCKGQVYIQWSLNADALLSNWLQPNEFSLTYGGTGKVKFLNGIIKYDFK